MPPRSVAGAGWSRCRTEGEGEQACKLAGFWLRAGSARDPEDRRSSAPVEATKDAALQNVFSGSDGTRTRELRRDRRALRCSQRRALSCQVFGQVTRSDSSPQEVAGSSPVSSTEGRRRARRAADAHKRRPELALGRHDSVRRLDASRTRHPRRRCCATARTRCSELPAPERLIAWGKAPRVPTISRACTSNHIERERFQSEQLKSGGRDDPAPHSCASLSGARTRRPAPSRCGRAAAQ
jgi:hypothetical protein